jgi:hypothetical protein
VPQRAENVVIYALVGGEVLASVSVTVCHPKTRGSLGKNEGGCNPMRESDA